MVGGQKSLSHLQENPTPLSYNYFEDLGSVRHGESFAVLHEKGIGIFIFICR